MDDDKINREAYRHDLNWDEQLDGSYDLVMPSWEKPTLTKTPPKPVDDSIPVTVVEETVPALKVVAPRASTPKKGPRIPTIHDEVPLYLSSDRAADLEPGRRPSTTAEPDLSAWARYNQNFDHNEQGEQGEQGERGERGEQGEQGEQGEVEIVLGSAQHDNLERSASVADVETEEETGGGDAEEEEEDDEGNDQVSRESSSGDLEDDSGSEDKDGEETPETDVVPIPAPPLATEVTSSSARLASVRPSRRPTRPVVQAKVAVTVAPQTSARKTTVGQTRQRQAMSGGSPPPRQTLSRGSPSHGQTLSGGSSQPMQTFSEAMSEPSQVDTPKTAKQTGPSSQTIHRQTVSANLKRPVQTMSVVQTVHRQVHRQAVPARLQAESPRPVQAPSGPLIILPTNQHEDNGIVAPIVMGCVGAAVVGCLIAGVFYRRHTRMQHHRKHSYYSGDEADEPTYGITGPAYQHGSFDGGVSGPVGDGFLARSAEAFHFQQCKRQIKSGSLTSNTSSSAKSGRSGSGRERYSVHSDCVGESSGSSGEEEEDGEEDGEEQGSDFGDYTVYECPGLAPASESFEVVNPLFAHQDRHNVTVVVSDD
ncbi:hypothetical protein BV898_18612 [Hypsibius exemplaris]|uniref:Uncharacterized protein n=1 Tax=Hypsibius exemplaris TaxID=2072580 RepID=A0A9X6RNM8_HYPEX|nr:hypothetical protein BV898_18612 [Hypsibius exemplaris]